jgi:hypothetical protein
MARFDPIYAAWMALNPQHPWPTQLGEPAGNGAGTAAVETPARKAARAKWLGVGKGEKRQRERTPEQRAYMREYQRRRRAAGDHKGEASGKAA